MLELKDTIEMMQSNDYKERFKAEYYQVKIRYIKLLAMVINWQDEKLNFEPTCNINIYKIQLGAMSSYLHLLEERAKIEGIELEEE